MNHSPQIDQVAASLYAVHRDITNPPRDAKGQVRGNPNYRYLSLPALLEYVRPIFKEASAFFWHEITEEPGGMGFTVFVMHLTGQWMAFGPMVMPAPADPQQRGSVNTYGRRYSLCSVLGIAADDDDDAASVKVEPDPVQGEVQGSPGTSGRGNQGVGKADTEDSGGTRMGKAGRAGADGGGEGVASSPAQPPSAAHDEYLRQLRSGKGGARRSLAQAKLLFEHGDRTVASLTDLSLDECVAVLEALKAEDTEAN